MAVALRCTFCHDALVRPDAAYCASCLAPHHADCFGAHGRCAAPGCAERASVRCGATAPRRWPLVGAAAALAALAAAAGGYAGARPRALGPGPVRHVGAGAGEDPCGEPLVGQLASGGVEVAVEVGVGSPLVVEPDVEEGLVRARSGDERPAGSWRHTRVLGAPYLVAAEGTPLVLRLGGHALDVTPRPGGRVIVRVGPGGAVQVQRP